MHPGIFGERRDRTALFFRIKFYNLPVNPVICVIDGKASCIFAQTAQPFRFSTQLIKFAAQPCSCQVFFLNDNRGMFWRFWALADENVERVIMRDADSRLTLREKAAVDEWERSDLAGHIMRDHPYHGMPVMGGMWGCKGGIFQDIKTQIEGFAPTDAHNQDQLFLEKIIYPRLIAVGCCVHDPFFRYESTARPFPMPRQNYAFVGEAIGCNGERENHWQILREYEESPLRRLRFACKRQVLALRLRLFGRIG